MQMKEVISSQISKIGWKKDVLHVIFNGANHVYRYADVPREKFDTLLASESVGALFNMLIRGQHPHTKHEIA